MKAKVQAREMDDTRADEDASSNAAAPAAVSRPPPPLDSVSPSYEPMVGRITEKQLIKARDEFERRAAQGEQDFTVPVARQVPAELWETSSVDISGNDCRVDVIFSPDQTLVDVELVDSNAGDPHEAAVANVIGQLRDYARQRIPREFICCAEGIILFEDGRRVNKKPDTGLKPDPDLVQGFSTPRLVVEVSVSHYTLPKAQREYHKYFDAEPTVRAVLLIKLYGIEDDGRTAAAAAILYHRDDRDNVVVDDSISFGTADLKDTDKAALDKMDATQGFRDLSGGPNGDLSTPAVFTIPATDLYYDTTLVDGTGALLQPRPDLVINLWEVFDEYFLCPTRI